MRCVGDASPKRCCHCLGRCRSSLGALTTLGWCVKQMPSCAFLARACRITTFRQTRVSHCVLWVSRARGGCTCTSARIGRTHVCRVGSGAGTPVVMCCASVYVWSRSHPATRGCRDDAVQESCSCECKSSSRTRCLPRRAPASPRCSSTIRRSPAGGDAVTRWHRPGARR